MSVMTHIKMAELRATDEGSNLLIRLMKTPGLVVKSADVIEDSLTQSIEEGGGSVWWCGTCDTLCSPNRPCSCAEQPVVDGSRYVLSLTSSELGHVLRALKFCKHNKERLQLHPKDKEWIDAISSVIGRVEQEEK